MYTREQAIAELTAPGSTYPLQAETDNYGAELRVYDTQCRTLRDVLLSTQAFDDKIYLVFENERISYAQHFQQVAALAHWLIAQGVRKGDRVAIGMRNYPEWPISFFACQAIGAIAVTLNAWWIGEELHYGLSDSQSKVALLDADRYASLESFLPQLKDLQVLIVRDHEGHQPALSWRSALDAYAEVQSLPEVVIEPHDLSSIMYTSGTTGRPKGALHTHRNHITNIHNTLLAGAVGAQLSPPQEGTPAQACALQTFPFFHIGGLSGLYIAAVGGARLVLMYKWDVEQAIDLIRTEGVTSWSGVPTVVRQLLEHPRATDGSLASLASIASGGAPVPEDLIQRVGNMFEEKVAPGNGYGATETTSAIIVNGGADYLARPQSVRRPVVTVDARLVDEQGNNCDIGTIGELWVRGPNIFAGYWGKEEATADAFDNGWFKTGDLAYVDDEGFYYVVDRKKDVIIRGGENIYCAAVEGVLHKHPHVADVALIGLPHRELGEEVAAVIELQPGIQPDEAELQAYVAEHMSRFNVPSKIFFVDEPLPRTATGKVLKRELKQRFFS